MNRVEPGSLTQWLLPLFLLSTAAVADEVHLTWLHGKRMEVVLEGQRYVGAWSDKRCFTPQCRGVYRNVLRHERRHIRQGQAELLTTDGARLVCTWVSHLPEVRGTCTAGDGRRFELRQAVGLQK